MPRRKPISPTVAPTYADSRAPAASTSSTSPADACRPAATYTIAPTYPAPKTAQADRVPDRPTRSGARTRSAYHRDHAARRSRTSRSPMPMTRTSLPGGAVVAMTNRWRASRLADRAALLRLALDGRPPARREHGRQREQREQDQPRVDRHEQHDRDRPAAGSSRSSRTPTCTCGRARTPARAARTADRDSPGARDGRSSRPWPAAGRRATPARS